MYQFQYNGTYNSVSVGHSPIKETKVVGQCYYHLHKGYLTQKTLYGHKCLEKHCRFLALKPDVNIESENKKRHNEFRNKTYIELLRKLKSLKMISEEQCNMLMKNASSVSKEQKIKFITKYQRRLAFRNKFVRPINIFIMKYKWIMARVRRLFIKV